MFGKRSTEGNTTIIGRGARFVGTLELEGAVFIEGECEGTIRTKSHLALGPGGSVRGELRGNTVSIAGKMLGTIVADETLHVTSTGAVEGEVFYGKLDVKPGGVIDGKTHQGAPATAGASVPALEGDVAAVPAEQSGVMKATRSVSSFPQAGEPRRSSAPGAR
jgi:cytoskeletal protein CcmA (bactofilin family)